MPIARGFDPSTFMITKDAFLTGPSSGWDYTITLNDMHCQVTKPNDEALLDYFHACCLALDGKETARRSSNEYLSNWLWICLEFLTNFHRY